MADGLLRGLGGRTGRGGAGRRGGGRRRQLGRSVRTGFECVGDGVAAAETVVVDFARRLEAARRAGQSAGRQ